MWQDDWKGSGNRINVFTSTVEAREEDQVDNKNEHNFMKKKRKKEARKYQEQPDVRAPRPRNASPESQREIIAL